ncbi:UNVERIFIED_CONTAM: hypothetical protein FKN15_017322 [Acipenser sinensis]
MSNYSFNVAIPCISSGEQQVSEHLQIQANRLFIPRNTADVIELSAPGEQSLVLQVSSVSGIYLGETVPDDFTSLTCGSARAIVTSMEKISDLAQPRTSTPLKE